MSPGLSFVPWNLKNEWRNTMPQLDQTHINEAVDALEQAKTNFNAAKLALADAESVVLDLVGGELKEEGTTRIGDLKLATGFTRRWDQDKLTNMIHDIRAEYWPFRTEFKEDRKASKVLAERFPELWQTLSPALTLTPRKPSITIDRKETKETA